MAEDLSIGLDIGGTKMAFVLADRGGNVHAARTLPTNSHQGIDDTLARITREVNLFIEAHRGIRGLGIGLPGPVDAARGIALQAANLGWEHVAIRDALCRRLAKPLPIYVENDVSVGAIGEQLFGSAQGLGNYVYLAIGTGLGGAVMLNNQLLRGATHAEMEIGHISLDPVAGRPCACGGRGCLEMSISGKGLLASAHEFRAEYPESRLHAAPITTRAVLRQAEAGDPLALHALDEAAAALGIACAWCANLFNPELILLGGGLAHACYHLIESKAQRVMAAHSLKMNFDAARLALAQLKDAALGAAALVWHQQNTEASL